MQWPRVFTLSRAIDLFIYGGDDVGGEWGEKGVHVRGVRSTQPRLSTPQDHETKYSIANMHQ